MSTVDIRTLLRRMPYTVRVGDAAGGAVEFTSIQAAINYCVTQTPTAANRWTVLVGPGTYAEELTMAQYVDVVGVSGPEDTIVSVASPVGLSLVILASNILIANIHFTITAPVGAKRIFMDNAVACTGVVMRNVVADIVTVATSRVILLTGASSVRVEGCWFELLAGSTAGMVLRQETAASTIVCVNSVLIADNAATAVLASNFAGGVTRFINCRLSGLGLALSVGAAATVTIEGGSIDCKTPSSATTGSVTWKTRERQYEVMAGMSIQHAITAAAADAPAPAASTPYTVLVHPGVYDEALTASSFVYVRGVERDSCIIQQTDANIVTIGAVTFTLSDMTLTLVTPTVARALVLINAVAPLSTLRNLRFTVTTPGGVANILVSVTGAATLVVLEDCVVEEYTGGAAAAAIGISVSAAATVKARRCDFTLENTGAFVYSVTAAGGLLTLLDCRAYGTATHLRATAGILRVRTSQYRSVARSVTGVILDDSPWSSKVGFRSVTRDWPLAAIANQNIATRTAVGGIVTPGGTGQVRLRINDNAADAAGVEQAADAAGSLASTWTPARGVRYVLQIAPSNAVGSSFKATSTMFYGLRATLGAAVPGAAEHHAGFIWNGANFQASSSNGGGVGLTTNLTTPTTGVHTDLEIVIVGGVQVEFYVGGVLVATHSAAAEVPTAALYFQEYEISNGAGGATTSDITLREGFLQESPT